MIAMLARITQIFLVVFGILLVLMILVPVHNSAANPAAAGAYWSGVIFGKMIDVFLGLLCFLGAYRLGKRRNKTTSAPQTSRP
jgi:LytS/YehU family sensor histidine kinase